MIIFEDKTLNIPKKCDVSRKMGTVTIAISLACCLPFTSGHMPTCTKMFAVGTICRVQLQNKCFSQIPRFGRLRLHEQILIRQ